MKKSWPELKKEEKILLMSLAWTANLSASFFPVGISGTEGEMFKRKQSPVVLLKSHFTGTATSAYS